MTNPPCAIWRATSTSGNHTGNESDADSIVQFELTAAPVVDSTAHLHQTEYRLKSGVGENEKSLAQANELQDTKFEGLTVIITGTCQIFVPPGVAGAGTRTGNPQISKVWEIEDKVDSTYFPRGLFGIRTDDFPDFNLNPKNDIGNNKIWGIIIQDWTWTKNGEQANRLDFVATLRYNFGTMGLSTGPISGRYVWS